MGGRTLFEGQEWAMSHRVSAVNSYDGDIIKFHTSKCRYLQSVRPESNFVFDADKFWRWWQLQERKTQWSLQAPFTATLSRCFSNIDLISWRCMKHILAWNILHRHTSLFMHLKVIYFFCYGLDFDLKMLSLTCLSLGSKYIIDCTFVKLK